MFYIQVESHDVSLTWWQKKKVFVEQQEFESDLGRISLKSGRIWTGLLLKALNLKRIETVLKKSPSH